MFLILNFFLGLWTTTALAETITLQLKWVHQAQFAGFYLAREKGYYRNEDLEVHFLEGGKEVAPADSLASGRAQFTVLSPEYILLKRCQGFDVTAVAAIYRRSAVVFIARQDSGIVRPYDFKGKRVAILGQEESVKDFEFQFYAMMKNLRLNISDLTLLEYDPEYSAFYEGDIDVTAAYGTGGLIKIQQRGYNPVIIWPGDYRVRFYSDTLATTQDIIQNRPGLVQRFLRASVKGWKDAVEDPEKALAHILKYARIKEKKIQQAMLEASLPLIHTGEDKIGWMRDKDWQHMKGILVDQGILPERCKKNSDQAYTLEFLHQIYRDNTR